MKKPKITRLYKYLPYSVNSLAILIKDQIWYPTPDTFNDPFDCRATEIGSIRDLEDKRRKEYGEIEITDENSIEVRVHSLLKGAYTRVTEQDKENYALYHELEAEMQHAIHSFGILSLSEKGNEILMWSHYADDHKGFCIEFEREGSNQLGEDAEQVVYSKCRKILEHSGDPKKGDIFNKKYKKWSYEKEWRVYQIHGNKYYPLPGRIKSVIIGAKMDSDKIDVIKSIIGNKNMSIENESEIIKLSYAKMHRNKYKIQIKT